MRMRTKWLACWFGAAVLATPAAVRAQGVPEPSWQFPLPLMLDQKESGFYFASESLFMRLNNPIRHQTIARRGFVDEAGQIRGQGGMVDLLDTTTQTGGNYLTTMFEQQGPAGAFYGSGASALSTTDVDSESYEPGYRLTFGYRLQNDLSVEFSYWRLAESRQAASAGIMPANFNVGNDYADSFLFVPFHNFSPTFAGPNRDILSNVLPVPQPSDPTDPAFDTFIISQAEIDELTFYRGLPVIAFGIWNGAEDVRAEFTQNIWNVELNFRVPLLQTDCTRAYALVGPRHINIREEFELIAFDATIEGDYFSYNTAIYTAEWWNRLYGLQFGLGNETYLGNGFACSVETRIGIFADIFYSNTKIVRADEAFAQREAQNDTAVSPMLQLGAYLWWYPIEGVQIRGGYEFMGLFNVLRSTNPIDYNLGRLEPEFDEVFLHLDGWNLGVAFIF